MEATKRLLAKDAYEGCPSQVRALDLKRRDGVRFPHRWPTGWVPLPVAVALILHQTAGNLSEQSWVDALVDVFDMSNATDFRGYEEGAASKVGTWLIDNVSTLCATEVLETGYRPIQGGMPVARMNPDWWDIEDVDLRFRSWSIDPEDPHNMADNLPCWIFVTNSSLRLQVDRIFRQRWDNPKLTFYERDTLYDIPQCMQAVASKTGLVGADGLRVVAALCAETGASSVARQMIQAFRDVPCVKERDWEIPPHLWAHVDPSDLRNSIDESLVVAVSGNTAWALAGIFVTKQHFDDALKNLASLAPLESHVSCDPSKAAGKEGGQRGVADPPRGVLPAHAKANDKRHEEYAHQAACIVRDRGVAPNTAFGEVAPEDKMRAKDSVVRAIRQSFELMYDAKGMPHQN